MIRRVPLRPRSIKRAEQEREYSERRKRYLAEHPICELWPGCKRRATEIHHIRGRNGKRLNDERYWRSGCMQCHRRVHDSPAEARELGLLLHR